MNVCMQSPVKHIQIAKNEGLAEKQSYQLSSDINFKQLKKQIKKNLQLKKSIKFLRIYKSDGIEIFSTKSITNNDILFVSEGEPFYLSTMENIQVSLLGSGGVGKSAITLRMIRNIFVSEWEPTIEDAFRKPIKVDDTITMLEILDTAGQEDYSTMRAQWMTNKDGFLIVYSVVDIDSVKHLRCYIDLFEQICKEGHLLPPIIFVGNKIDLISKDNKYDNNRTAVQQEIACLIDICMNSIARINDQFETRHLSLLYKGSISIPSYKKVRLIETSAFTGDGVQDVFMSIVREVRLQRKLKSYLENVIENQNSWSSCSIT